MKIYIRNIMCAATLAFAAQSALAGVIDDARKLYHEGSYEAVIERMTPQVRKTPRDGNATFYLGASLWQLGRYAEAEEPLTVAESRGVAEASRMLAITALDNYDASAAAEHLEQWEAIQKKNKKSVPAEHAELTSRMVQMQNMLDRVERIEILDSLVVDAATFFEHYRLSATAGRILPPDAVERLGAGNGDLSPAYMPENRSEVLWAAADDNGRYQLYGAGILDDGSIDHAEPLDSSLGDGGDASYPFLMADGMTLYFAANGAGSLGGYDIFMTRRNDGSYFKPQNMGMPYNSPFDDYLLAIDETSGLGWWATDRNRIPGKVTIYIFTPAATRVNVDPDDPNIAALAKLSNISLTQKSGVDYAALLDTKMPVGKTDVATTGSPRFALDMGNGKVYTSLSDFKNGRARGAMLDVLTSEAKLRKQLESLEALRERYRRGDSSVTDVILSTEHEVADLYRHIADQRNTAVRLEK